MKCEPHESVKNDSLGLNASNYLEFACTVRFWGTMSPNISSWNISDSQFIPSNRTMITMMQPSGNFVKSFIRITRGSKFLTSFNVTFICSTKSPAEDNETIADHSGYNRVLCSPELREYQCAIHTYGNDIIRLSK